MLIRLSARIVADATAPVKSYALLIEGGDLRLSVRPSMSIRFARLRRADRDLAERTDRYGGFATLLVSALSALLLHLSNCPVPLVPLPGRSTVFTVSPSRRDDTRIPGRNSSPQAVLRHRLERWRAEDAGVGAPGVAPGAGSGAAPTPPFVPGFGHWAAEPVRGYRAATGTDPCSLPSAALAKEAIKNRKDKQS